MTFTIIIAALLLWVVIGGIVAILVCPLLRERSVNPKSQIQPSEETTVTDQASPTPAHK